MKPKKTTPQKAKAAKTKVHPVPEWMDENVKAKAEKLDVSQRIELAEKLEKAALELREMKPARIAPSIPVTTYIRTNMQKLLIEFYERHGGDEKESDEIKAAVGIRWFLEGALPGVANVSKAVCKRVDYSKAEGLEDSVYTEQLIEAAHKSWVDSLDNQHTEEE